MPVESTFAPPTLADRLAQREAPGGPNPVMYQRWSDLLFLHWDYDPAVIRNTLPPGLSLDTHEGRAWVGLVPFRMSGIRPRGFPPLPWLSAFPEMNVRTYVHDEAGRPGVWFYSLDASRWLAVQWARRIFHLPYHHAAMTVKRESSSGWIEYHSRRHDGAAEASFRYRGTGEAVEAEPGSLDFFLVERYLLFAHDARNGQILRGRVAHSPYRYCPAEVARFGVNPVTAAGLPAPPGEPVHAVHVESVEVQVYSLECGE